MAAKLVTASREGSPPFIEWSVPQADGLVLLVDSGRVAQAKDVRSAVRVLAADRIAPVTLQGRGCLEGVGLHAAYLWTAETGQQFLCLGSCILCPAALQCWSGLHIQRGASCTPCMHSNELLTWHASCLDICHIRHEIAMQAIKALLPQEREKGACLVGQAIAL